MSDEDPTTTPKTAPVSSTSPPHQYTISITKIVFDKLLLNIKPDIKVLECFNLTGAEWFKPIHDAIAAYEDKRISLGVDQSRLYINPKRSNTVSKEIERRILQSMHSVIIVERPEVTNTK